ncbi:hypothetical protein Noc_0231 [Nitrosococcus oceani ATCC 19707]|uniref:Uncharacterized protein n=3 Tax=Nitrosococcus oceani TaxID=1229 RepID=Q3JEI5_NITOC|nr:hypothetical protein [Nitrosococcus oceani]ABA56761.1 hypothetical protein Noc_0231 [Nitrosococcus oceani ATCC 19707]KFI20715.1 hypothetical protein IB75_01180 [Nitrosococcus oceani C-27]GEM20518.1 hypothetical protein NONS58_19370 [Nitrosococcus oceani]
MVTKAELLTQTAQQASIEANKRHLNDSATEQLQAEAQAIVKDIFRSIGWENSENVPEIPPNPLTAWHHRTLNDRELDWRNLNFAQEELQQAAGRYLRAPWLHCRELDWLVLNTLIYGDYLAALDTIRARTMPFSRYQSRKSGKTGFRVLTEAWRGALLLLKIAAWFIIFAAVSPASPLGPLIWIGMTGWWLWRKWMIRRKNNALLKSMFSAYGALSPTHLDWPRIWEGLEKSQALGAVWNNMIYPLVEMRMQKI